MIYVVLSMSLFLGSSQAFFSPGPLWSPGWMEKLVPSRCRASPVCPRVDCRFLQPVVFGYCCGCALPIDHIPMVCPLDISCPEDMDSLCRDYNFLMDCCC